MKRVKKIIYVLMFIVGIILLGGFVVLLFKGDVKKINLHYINIYDEITDKYNNKKVIASGVIKTSAVDPEFNVTIDESTGGSVGIKRIVRKWDGDYWELVEKDTPNEKYTTKYFFGDEIKLGNYKLENINLSNRSYSEYLNDLYINKENIIIPEGFKEIIDFNYQTGTGYSMNLYSVITNSEDINNPKVGDLRINFVPINKQIHLIGMKNDDIITVNSYEDCVDCSFITEYEYTFILFIKILIVITLFIAFIFTFFGLKNFDIFKKKFGNIKGYKLVILAIVLDIIVYLLFLN